MSVLNGKTFSEILMAIAPLVLTVTVVVFGLNALFDKISKLEATVAVQHDTMKAQVDLQEKINASVEKFENSKTTIIREVRYAQGQIEEAAGAEELVPRDVALAWAAGIDGLRNDPGGEDRSGGGSESTAEPERL